MDKFEEAVRQNIYLSSEKHQSFSLDKSAAPIDKHWALNISYDNFKYFCEVINKIDISIPIVANIYDEQIIKNNDDLVIRIRFLQELNRQQFKKITFNLSDATLPFYNQIMTRINWKHSTATELYLSIDRHPIDDVNKDLSLPLAKGKLILPVEKLIWEKVEVLKKLHGKIDDQILEDALSLKRLASTCYLNLSDQYFVEEMNDFDKTYLIYNYIYQNINSDDETFEPFEVFKKKMGNNEGQSRLMSILLNNPYMRVDSTSIKGTNPLGDCTWVGTVINDKLYQSCISLAGPFKNLTALRYIPNKDEVYPKIYRKTYLGKNNVEKVMEHVKTLKR